MLRKIHLHGALAQHYGKEPIELDIDTPAMLFAGLNSALPKFQQRIREHTELYLVKRIDETTAVCISEETWEMPFGDATEIHLIPKIEGQGFELSVMAIIKAVAIQIAVNFVIGQIVQALAPTPKAGRDTERPENKPSFIFNGAVNVIEEGYPVPIVFGKLRAGSVVISVGSDTVDIAA